MLAPVTLDQALAGMILKLPLKIGANLQLTLALNKDGYFGGGVAFHDALCISNHFRNLGHFKDPLLHVRLEHSQHHVVLATLNTLHRRVVGSYYIVVLLRSFGADLYRGKLGIHHPFREHDAPLNKYALLNKEIPRIHQVLKIALRLGMPYCYPLVASRRHLAYLGSIRFHPISECTGFAKDAGRLKEGILGRVLAGCCRRYD